MDLQGEDAVAVIKGETITIKAVYVVHPMCYSKDEAAQMQHAINSALNDQNYKVSEGEYAGMSVKFDLQFKHNDLDGSPSIKEDFSYDGNPIGNNFLNDKLVGAKTEIDEVNNATSGTVGGITKGKNEIIMRQDGSFDSEKYKPWHILNFKIHEIFHTFFLNKDGASSGVHSYSNPGLPNQEDIDDTINNEMLPKVNEND